MNDDVPWKVDEALRVLQARLDPYIWDQGQELFRRGAVQDIAMGQDSTVRVIVLDPRDARKFFVNVRKEFDGRVQSRCACPYRLDGFCRHQVVALEYLKRIAAGESVPDADEPRSARSNDARRESAQPSEASGSSRETASLDLGALDLGEGPILERLFGGASEIATAPDGSVLRVLLLSLGSLSTPSRVALQLRSENGWGEVRTPDLERWIGRGRVGVHPRDAALRGVIAGAGELRSELDAETLGYLLQLCAGTEALVDRAGRALRVEREPWRLRTRVERAGDDADDDAVIRVRWACVSPSEREVPFDEVILVPSIAPWLQLEDGAFRPLAAGAAGPYLAEIQESEFVVTDGEELDRFLVSGMETLERLTPSELVVEDGLIEEVEGVDEVRLVVVGRPPGELSGTLQFAYAGEWVDAPESPTPWTLRRDGTVRRFPAAGQSLARARRELESAGFEKAGAAWTLRGEDAFARALTFRGQTRIEWPDEVRAFDLVHRAPRVALRIDGEPPESGGAGWLEVSFELSDGGRRLDVDGGELVDAFERSGSNGVLRLADETVLSLDHTALRDVIEILRSARAAGNEISHDGPVRVPAYSIGAVLDSGEDVEIEATASVESLFARLRRSTPGGGERVQTLEGATESLLRPYQRAAVEWFGDLAAWGLGGILADEMGLGKTVMALAHFFGRADADLRAPILVVCPTSLAFNWLDECNRFFPRVRAAGVQGLRAREREERIAGGEYDLLVTSYALLRRDRECYEARSFRGVVLDEAHHIKNPESQTAKAAYSLSADERWALTGTPVENHLGELWSVFRFVSPEVLGSRREFQDEFRDPADRGDTGAVERLRRRVRPFVLRRTKDQVLAELPPRIEQTERVPMLDLQRGLYEAQLVEARAAAEQADGQRGRFAILAALTRLRQVCCHPRLVADEGTLGELAASVGDGAAASSGKFELLFELLEECVEEEHRALVFSQFTSMLDLIEERLDEIGMPRCRLDGSTRDREAEVRRFESDASIPVFLISLKAGGHGLNLTGADTVILYDPWWNPQTEEQAVARAHRMGQELPVHVHRLIVRDSIEERIQDLQDAKRDLADRLLAKDGEDPLAGIGLDDLKALLLD